MRTTTVGNRIYEGCFFAGLAVATLASCSAEAPMPATDGRATNQATYRTSMYYPDSQNAPRSRKGRPDRAYRSNGEKLTLPQLYQTEKVAYREKYGPFSIDFIRSLRGLGHTRLDVGIYFKPKYMGPGERRKPSAQTRIDLEGQLLAGELEQRGFSVRRVSKFIPAIFVSGKASEILSLKSDSRFARIVAAKSLRPQPRTCADTGGAYDCVDTQPFHGMQQTLPGQPVAAFQGLHGEKQKVGILGDVQQEYKVGSGQTGGRLAEHEAFANNEIVYQDPNTDSSWPVTAHETWVASVVSANSHLGGECGASAAKIYYPNDGLLTNWPSGNVYTQICNPEATNAALEWLANQGNPAYDEDDPKLLTVNESWGCLHENILGPVCNSSEAQSFARDMEGINEDYYALYTDMLVVKAAGNNNCLYDEGPQAGVGSHVRS